MSLMRLVLVFALSLPVHALAEASAPEPAAVSESAPEKSAEQVPAAKAEETPDQAPTFCAAGKATELLEQGRKVQREKGAGGAKEAIALYRKALEADADCDAARWELGWSHQVAGELEQAVAAWDELKQRRADYPGLEEHYPAMQKRRDDARALGSLPPAKKKTVDEAPAEGEGISIAAVGDITMGRNWPADKVLLPPDGGRDLFAGIQHLLNKTDVTFGNLETVLGDTGESTKCRPKSTRCYAFRAPSAYAQVLKDVGFDVLSIANNHTGDFGPNGRRQTIEALDRVGLLHSGPVGDVARWEVKGRKVAMIAFSFGADVHRIQEIETGKRLVSKLAEENDLVIVSFHAGAEGRGADRVPHGVEKAFGENRGDSRKFARAMVDAGADLLLGHGPHVLRGMEIYKGRLIAYSLGNFSAWHNFSLRGPGGITAVLEVELAPNGVARKAQLHSGIIEAPGRPVPDPAGKAVARVRELSKLDFGAELFDEQGVWTHPTLVEQAAR